jgi:hypothetical protein
MLQLWGLTFPQKFGNKWLNYLSKNSFNVKKIKNKQKRPKKMSSPGFSVLARQENK